MAVPRRAGAQVKETGCQVNRKVGRVWMKSLGKLAFAAILLALSGCRAVSGEPGLIRAGGGQAGVPSTAAAATLPAPAATLPAPAVRVTPDIPERIEPTFAALEESSEGASPGQVDAAAEVTLEAEASPPALSICSPLVGDALEDLWLITSDPYRPPPPGDDGRHEGVDFSYYRRGERESILGAGVQAVLPGWAAASLSDTFPYGNFVILETPAHLLPVELIEAAGLEPGESLYTVYAHLLQRPRVSVGDWVEACQYLGEVGNSGNANVAHLHLETRTGPAGALFFQMSFYRPDDTAAERENYLRWRTGGEYLHFDPLLVLNWTEQNPD